MASPSPAVPIEDKVVPIQPVKESIPPSQPAKESIAAAPPVVKEPTRPSTAPLFDEREPAAAVPIVATGRTTNQSISTSR